MDGHCESMGRTVRVVLAGAALTCLLQGVGPAGAGEADGDAELRRAQRVVRIPGLDATTPKPLPRYLYASQQAVEESLAGDAEARRKIGLLTGDQPFRLDASASCSRPARMLRQARATFGLGTRNSELGTRN